MSLKKPTPLEKKFFKTLNGDFREGEEIKFCCEDNPEREMVLILDEVCINDSSVNFIVATGCIKENSQRAAIIFPANKDRKRVEFY